MVVVFFLRLNLSIKMQWIQETVFDMMLFSFSRVLTLWFDYGHWPEVNEALVEGIKTIQIDTWLQVRISHACFWFAFIVLSIVSRVLEN